MDAVDRAGGLGQLIDAVPEQHPDRAVRPRAGQALAGTARARPGPCPRSGESAGRSCRARSPRSRRARPSRGWAASAPLWRAATPASRRARTPHMPSPTAAATRPRGGRTPPCPPSPARPARASRLHAPAPLLGGVDHEQAAQRPVRLPTQALLGLLLDEHDPLAGVGQLSRGHQPGQAGADHDHVRLVSVFRHPAPSYALLPQSKTSSAACDCRSGDRDAAAVTGTSVRTPPS